MNKKKLLIFICIIVVVLVLIVTTVIVIKKSKDEEIQDNGHNIDHSVRVTGKLEQYISNLADNYYIKYSGKFKDNSGNFVDAIIEYTKSGDKFALRSNEINMQLIYDGHKLYSVDNRYKMLVSMDKNYFDIREYNLASDINQVFVKSYKEKIGSTEYDVEEYVYNGKTLKYYFKQSDMKLIKYDGRDTRVIRLENSVNREMLVLPEGYAIV